MIINLRKVINNTLKCERHNLVPVAVDHIDCFLELFIRHPENNVPRHDPHATGGETWTNIFVI